MQCTLHAMPMNCAFSEIFSLEDVAKPWIYMRGVSSQLMESLLMFIYAGEVEIQADQLSTFMEMASDMKIRGLTKYVASQADQVLTNQKHMAMGILINHKPGSY